MTDTTTRYNENIDWVVDNFPDAAKRLYDRLTSSDGGNFSATDAVILMEAIMQTHPYLVSTNGSMQ